MSANPLSENIVPWRLAETNETLEGSLDLAIMQRLTPSLEKPTGKVKYVLKFAKDEVGFIVIYGKIHALLPLICQRCLKPVNYLIDKEFVLSPVLNDAEVQNLPDQYDPLVTESDAISLVTLVEEELLLCLPIVPMHPEAECSVKLPKVNEEEVIKAHPLAALAKLKKKLK